uniref:Uncharacterized protein n=1 Tax=Anopheles darlingi TaxID=43151 RepID=A0A2M4DMR2_ANODA
MLQLLGDLLLGGLFAGKLIATNTSIVQLSKQVSAIVFSLGLQFVQLIDLLGHLGDGIVVLLAQVSQSALMLDVGLLQIAAQLGQLSLTLLVQLNLGRGGTASLLQTLAQLLELTGQISALLLSLGASLTLGLDLLLQLLNASLQLLDLLLQLADQRLLVLQLGGQGRDLLVLAQDGLLELLLVALQIGDGLLGQLQVTLNLALRLLNITAQLLLALERILQLIQSLLQLGLHLVQVVHLVFGGLQLLGGLLVDLTLHLLLLVQLVDQLILVGDLVVQVADLVILRGLVLLDLLDLQLQILGILLLASDFLLQLLLGLEELVAGILFLGQALLGVAQLVLQVVLLGGQLGGLLLVFLEGTLLAGQRVQESGLLSQQLAVQSLELLAHLLLLLEGLLCLGGLLFQFGDLVLNAGNVKQRLDLLPQLPPGPGTQLQVLAQIALDDLQGDALFLHLLELLTRQVTTAPGLHPGHDLAEALITELLHLTQDTGTEEDLGVTNTVGVRVQTDGFETLLGSLLAFALSLHGSWGQDQVAQLEVRVHHAVGESLTANTDTFKHTVTSQLVHDQVSINDTGRLHFVGNDTTDEVRLSRLQRGHQVVQLFLVRGRDSGETGTLLATTALGGSWVSRLAWVISEDLHDQGVGTLLELIDDSVVQRILVLLKPSGDVVRHTTGVVTDGEVTGLATWLRRARLLERSRLAQMVGHQLLSKGLIGGLREHRLFLKNRQDTHGLLNQINTRQQIHTEIDEGPVDTLPLVLLLLQHEHVVVEELLQLLVGEVNTQLLETVVVEDFETSNIQHTNELSTLLLGVQSLVTLLDQPFEDTIEDTLAEGTDRVGDLVLVLTLGDELVTDLNTWLQQILVQIVSDHTEQLGHTVTILGTVGFSLLFATLLLELHATHVHDSGSDLVDVVLLLLSETQNVEGFIGQQTFLTVIDVGNGDFTLGNAVVIVDVVRQEAHFFQSLDGARHELVEDVVRALQRLLRDDTSLLQQVGLNIGTSQLTASGEVDTDELTETRRVIVTDGLGVTEGLKYGVSLDDLIFQGALLLSVLVLLARRANGGEVRNDLLGVLSLSGTRFTGNQHRLVLMVGQHVDVGTVRHGEQMGRHFITALATVHLGATVGIQRVTLVRVDDNAEQARVGVDKLSVVSLSQVMEHRGIVKIRQVGHILAFLVFRWVDLGHQVLLVVLGLATRQANGNQVTLGGLDFTQQVALLLVRNPASLLGIVRLALIDTLLFERNEKERGWVRILSDLNYWLRHVGLGFSK